MLYRKITRFILTLTVDILPKRSILVSNESGNRFLTAEQAGFKTKLNSKLENTK